MAATLWPLCKLAFFATRMALVFLALMDNGYGIETHDSFPDNCAVYISQYEQQHSIPNGLLQAISKVESGRKDDTGRIVAWPWTVNAAGQGYYFPTKEKAITAVRAMQLKGVKSIDVGCMQVNLYHHSHAFGTLRDAFDPGKNVAYAARFLTGLKNEHASWNRAVAHYHSANPLHHIPYRKNVLNVWDRDIKNGGVSLAAGIFEAVSSQSGFPTVNRIRRLTSAKLLKLKRVALKKEMFIPTSDKSIVRRVVRGNSSHIRRMKAYQTTPRTFKRVS